ncbi:hypothetical protein, partial [Staphylococcus borealis]|uniref:hypothetical protein n=1 Tax=Staphylococcus borealis TaxID=2742203 RepID=UPI00374F6118
DKILKLSFSQYSRASAKRISKRNSTSKESCGSGLSKENFEKKFHKQRKLWFGAPATRISKRNSTSKESCGSGPQQREFRKEIPQVLKAGATKDLKFCTTLQ